jgi:hypothetical protein
MNWVILQVKNYLKTAKEIATIAWGAQALFEQIIEDKHIVTKLDVSEQAIAITCFMLMLKFRGDFDDVPSFKEFVWMSGLTDTQKLPFLEVAILKEVHYNLKFFIIEGELMEPTGETYKEKLVRLYPEINIIITEEDACPKILIK